jgi:hypothetical protein
VAGFGEDADHVVEVRRGAHAAIPPGVESHARNRAALAFLIESPRHRVADEIHAAHHERWDVRIHGIVERRHENPRREGTGLMLVVDDLRKPFRVELARAVPRFGLVHHEPVAVVVVADVLVPQLGRTVLPRPAEVLAIPVRHHRRAVGIHIRDEQENHVIANESHLVGLVRHRLEEHQRRGLTMRHFGRVQTEINPDDGFAFAGKRTCVFVAQAAIAVASEREFA